MLVVRYNYITFRSTVLASCSSAVSHCILCIHVFSLGSITLKKYFNYKIQITFLKSNLVTLATKAKIHLQKVIEIEISL